MRESDSLFAVYTVSPLERRETLAHIERAVNGTGMASADVERAAAGTAMTMADSYQ